MAGSYTHLRLAGQLIRNLFSGFTEAEADAFLLGSLAPDAGAFPKGDAFVSDLPHYVGAARLARELVALSSNPVERAFSLGWMSHVILDVKSHPIVNAEAGLRIGRTTPASFFENPPMHIRVELGFDAANMQYAVLHQLRRKQYYELLSTFVSSAFRVSYGIEFDPHSFHSSFDGMSKTLLRLAPILKCWGILWNMMPKQRDRSNGQTKTKKAGASSYIAALFPICPSAGFVFHMDEAIKASAREFEIALRCQFLSVIDANLDTGVVGFCDVTYEPARRSMALLNLKRFQNGLQPIDAF